MRLRFIVMGMLLLCCGCQREETIPVASVPADAHLVEHSPSHAPYASSTVAFWYTEKYVIHASSEDVLTFYTENGLSCHQFTEGKPSQFGFHHPYWYCSGHARPFGTARVEFQAAHASDAVETDPFRTTIRLEVRWSSRNPFD